MATARTGRRRAAGGRDGRLRGLTHRFARGGGVGGGSGVDGRIRLLRLVFIVFLVLVGGKAVALASSSANLTKIALEQQTATVALPAHRGAILDRNGQELAVGKSTQTVFATPYLLSDPGTATRELMAALQLHKKATRRDLLARLSNRTSGRGFAYVARDIDPALARAALALGLPGVGAYPEESRTYPMKGSAAQVIGFAGVDDNGLAGVELEYDKQLSGKAGSEVVVRDPAGQALKTISQTQPTAGQDVRLTLDEDIQYTAEDVLKHTLSSSYAKRAVAIVMDPRNGDILAMVNVPEVKNNNFGLDPANDANRAITDAYEPGSIFKLVTISGALADGTVNAHERFTLPPTLTLYGSTIHEAENRGTVNYNVKDILVNSSNVGAVKIGMKMGQAALLKWAEAYGFGKATGIGFPGESAGYVPAANQWSGTTIINLPMGQGISVTPLQITAAFAAVANDGVYVQPHLVEQVGVQVYKEPAGRRVIPARIAASVRKMLAAAVDHGTGVNAKIPGYVVAGKTGTAQKALPNGGGYSKTDYVASFIGMVPADHPRLVVMVAVDSPRTSIFGGDIAAPAVQKIMQFALGHLEIAP
jgi:cell division protein FtsI/penicillin-binding protein 2